MLHFYASTQCLTKKPKMLVMNRCGQRKMSKNSKKYFKCVRNTYLHPYLVYINLEFVCVCVFLSVRLLQAYTFLGRIAPELVWGGFDILGRSGAGWFCSWTTRRHVADSGTRKTGIRLCHVLDISGLTHRILGSFWIDFNHSWCVDRYTMKKYEYKKQLNQGTQHLA